MIVAQRQLRICFPLSYISYKLIFNVMMMRPALNKTNTLSWVCVEMQHTNNCICAITYFDNVYYTNRDRFRTFGKPKTFKYKISYNTNNQSRKISKWHNVMTMSIEELKHRFNPPILIWKKINM